MKKLAWLGLAIALALPLASGAQNNSRPGWGRNAGRQFDLTTLTTVAGTIASIDQPASRRRNNTGVHLSLKTESGTFEVQLGPSWYLDKQDMKFKTGETVSVKGSKMQQDKKEVIIAQEVTKEGKTMTLRDKNGIPAWSGGGKGLRRNG